MTMNKYPEFFETYIQAQSKEEKSELLKDFLFSLSTTELIAWFKEGNLVIKENLSQLIQTKDAENLQYVEECLDEMELFLTQKPIKKAA